MKEREIYSYRTKFVIKKGEQFGGESEKESFSSIEEFLDSLPDLAREEPAAKVAKKKE